jgi:hypothetical protein
MSDDRKYNGWTNYETWAIALWLNNDQGSQEHAIDLAREAYSDAEGEDRKGDAARELAEQLKEECEAGIPDGIAGTVYADLLQSAIDEADWYEIAESFLDDDLIKEIEDEEREERWDAGEFDLRRVESPGKFEGGLVIDEAIYDLCNSGMSDASEGDVQEHGHAYELVRAPISLDESDAPDLTPDERAYLRSLGGGAILTENSQGFVSVTYYDTAEAVDAAWDRIVADLTPDDDASDESAD